MTGSGTATVVRSEIMVEVAQARAFEVFTDGLTRWWPKSHHIGAQPLQELVIEPRAGGRWFERAADGSECDWGRVRIWDPPARLVLAWQISGEWAYDEALDTEVEVRFVPEGPERTRVELEHRLDGYGDRAGEMRDTFDSPGGWPSLLEAFAQAARQP
jgi:uncharacterized protein YndB with AHSA1/START domain